MSIDYFEHLKRYREDKIYKLLKGKEYEEARKYIAVINEYEADRIEKRKRKYRVFLKDSKPVDIISTDMSICYGWINFINEGNDNPIASFSGKKVVYVLDVT